MESQYIKAIETRLKWLRWARSGYASATWNSFNIAGVLNQYERVLSAGETYFMNRRFSNLVDLARQSIPDDIVWESAWMQSKQGFLWVEDPFTVPHPVEMTNVNIEIKIPAIGWFQIPPGTVTARGMSNQPNRVAGDNAFEFLCFQDFGQQDSRREGFGAWSYFMLQDGDKLIDRITAFEDLARDAGANGGEPGAYGGTNRDNMMHEIRWIFSAFHLMAQRLSMTVQHRTDRTVRRREQREKAPLPVPEYIKVVTLRRLEEDKKKQFGDDPGPVDWHWQWMVGGHWRNQWYPSEKVHKQVWIESYVKGPQDKPMKPPQHKIFIAQR